MKYVVITLSVLCFLLAFCFYKDHIQLIEQNEHLSLYLRNCLEDVRQPITAQPSQASNVQYVPMYIPETSPSSSDTESTNRKLRDVEWAIDDLNSTIRLYSH